VGQVLIRNIDDAILANLKLKAELSGKSLEQELRDILTNAAPMSADELVALSRRLRSAFAEESIDSRAAIRWGRDDELQEIERKFDAP